MKTILHNNEDENMSVKYMEGFLQKKEGDKEWVEYWTQICGRYFIFYKHKPTLENVQEEFKGCIEITENTKCIVAHRKKYSFPFYVSTNKSRYLFKTISSVRRHEWFKAIENAAKGKELSVQQNLEIQLESIEQDNASYDNRLTTDEQPHQHEILLSAHQDAGFDEVISHDNNSFEYSNENITSTTQCNIIFSKSAPIQTSCFFDRPNSSAEENHQISSPELDERLHEIYCGDATNKINDKLTVTTNKKHLTTPTFLYNKPNDSHLSPTRNITSKKLFKSAECLRDCESPNHRSSLLTSNRYLRNSSTSSKNTIFSRHLVHSAPDVKSLSFKTETK